MNIREKPSVQYSEKKIELREKNIKYNEKTNNNSSGKNQSQVNPEKRKKQPVNNNLTYENNHFSHKTVNQSEPNRIAIQNDIIHQSKDRVSNEVESAFSTNYVVQGQRNQLRSNNHISASLISEHSIHISIKNGTSVRKTNIKSKPNEVLDLTQGSSAVSDQKTPSAAKTARTTTATEELQSDIFISSKVGSSKSKEEIFYEPKNVNTDYTNNRTSTHHPSNYKYALRNKNENNTILENRIANRNSVKRTSPTGRNISLARITPSSSQRVFRGVSGFTKISSKYKKNSSKAKKHTTHDESNILTSKNNDTEKTDNTAANLIKGAGKAIKRVLYFIISVSSPLAICIIMMTILLLITTSVFGIFLSNQNNELTNGMNEIVEDYKSRISDIKNNSSYDTLSIEGSTPAWKEIIMGYCAKYSSTAAGTEQEVFAVFNDISKSKLKSVFWDMVTISNYIEETQEITTDAKGKKVTTTHRKLIITINALTALEYASIQSFNSEQIDNINLLSQVSDETWDNILDGVNSFSLLSGNFVGDWVYYDQTQYSNSFGDDTIAGSGCGPTSFAMVATYLTASSITPVDAIWCGNSYYVYGVGTSWAYFSAAADHFGFRMEEQTSSWSEAMDALRNGKPVISSQAPGLFTRGGHFIVLAGLDKNDNVIVYDPNGWNGYNPEGKGATFTPAQITASGTQYWIFDSDLNQGGNVAELAWRYLRNAGLSKQAAAGVIGNMMTECGGQTLDLDPTLYDEIYGTHYGLCQWDIHYFPDITSKSARAQLEFLCNDFMGAEIRSFGFLYRSGFTLEEFKSMTNVEEAAVAFAVVCERPGYEYNNYELRRNNAMKAYNYFKDQ